MLALSESRFTLEGEVAPDEAHFDDGFYCIDGSLTIRITEDKDDYHALFTPPPRFLEGAQRCLATLGIS